MAELYGKATGRVQGPRRLDARRGLLARHAGGQRHRRRRLRHRGRRCALGRLPRARGRSRCPSSATAASTREPSTRRSTSRPCERLPVVFVCENNQYAQYTAVGRTTSVDDLSRRADGLRHSRPVTVDGNDASRSSRRPPTPVERARAGEGPTLSTSTPTASAATSSATPRSTATKEEVEGRREHDPIPRLEGRLVAEGMHGSADASSRSGRSGRRGGRRGGAVRRGEPVPGAGGARSRGVHRERAPDQLRPGDRSRPCRSRCASDDRVIVLGEDIGWGGSFGQFRGLLDEFGPERVIDMPISEARSSSRLRRRRRHGPAARRLDELRRVHDGRDGRDRQPGREAPLHVRRPGERPARAPRLRRHTALLGRPALREPRGALRPRPRPEGRGARPRRPTRRGCSRRRSPTTIRSSTSRTRRSARAAGPVPEGTARGAARAGGRPPARAPTSRSSRTRSWRGTPSRPARSWPRRGSRSSSSICAASCRSISRRCSSRSRKTAPRRRLPRGVDGRRASAPRSRRGSPRSSSTSSRRRSPGSARGPSHIPFSPPLERAVVPQHEEIVERRPASRSAEAGRPAKRR